MTENASPPASTRRGLNRQELLTIVVALSAGIGFIVAYALKVLGEVLDVQEWFQPAQPCR